MLDMLLVLVAAFFCAALSGLIAFCLWPVVQRGRRLLLGSLTIGIVMGLVSFLLQFRFAVPTYCIGIADFVLFVVFVLIILPWDSKQGESYRDAE